MNKHVEPSEILDLRSEYVKRYYQQINLIRVLIYLFALVLIAVNNTVKVADPSIMGEAALFYYSIITGFVLTAVEVKLRTYHWMTYYHIFALPLMFFLLMVIF